jgi:mRNA-degrading endonuclease HigB of HigAB toxin-antitoxin module
VVFCSENHGLVSVISVLAKRMWRRPEELSVMFGDENSQRMAESGISIVEIAKFNNTKIIKNVIFK